MHPWQTYSDRFLSRHGIVSVAHADRRVGPLDDLVPPDALRAFERCREEDRAELARLLADPLHRLLVKLVMFRTKEVPRQLLGPAVQAAVRTTNPSFNKHFVFPCAIAHGRRVVATQLLQAFEGGTTPEKCGASRALYWCSVPRAQMSWPLASKPSPPLPDESIVDLVEAFEDLALEEFLRVEDLDLHRELVYHLPRAARRSPQRGALAIEAARNHADAYVRARVLVDLGESGLLPCKPPLTGGPQ